MPHASSDTLAPIENYTASMNEDCVKMEQAEAYNSVVKGLPLTRQSLLTHTYTEILPQDLICKGEVWERELVLCTWAMLPRLRLTVLLSSVDSSLWSFSPRECDPR